MNRSHLIQRASTEIFDVVIIGGGFTGAGIALTAARKGWKTLVIDKHDFAFGTSSRSAKMIHGGLRYLEHLQVKLVKEALHEREHLLKEYPHLVKPQPFFMPIYKSRFNKLKLGIGLTGYDYLSGESSLPKHKAINVKEIEVRFPQLKTSEMLGGYIYYDAKTNDARLVNDVIQEATELGAVAINYFEVKEFHAADKQTKSITCIDTLTGNTHTIRSKVFVVATGVWTDELLKTFDPGDPKKYMMPSKGVHLVMSADHFPKDCVMLFPAITGEKRMIWCMPWEENLNIVGATDTEYSSSNDQVDIEEDEVKYILDSVNAQMKDKKLTEKDILSVYAGIRPLLNDNDDHKSSAQRSRDYQVWWNNDNMLTISGGKLTSFLSMAENCMKTIEEKYTFAHPGPAVKNELENISLSDHFKSKYGIHNAALIAKIAQDDPQLLTEFAGYHYCPAEIIFFTRHQSAQKLDDVLTRRTSITHQMQNFDEVLVDSISKIIAKELNWTTDQVAQEIASYRKSWNLMHSWK